MKKVRFQESKIHSLVKLVHVHTRLQTGVTFAVA